VNQNTVTTTLEQGRQFSITIEPDEIKRSLRELGIRLTGLRYFFKIKYLPFGEAEELELADKDFVSEVRIAREALVRCLQILEVLKSDSLSGNNRDLEHDLNNNSQLLEFFEMLTDMIHLLDSLSTARVVDLHGFTSTGNIFESHLQKSSLANLLLRKQNILSPKLLNQKLEQIVNRIESDSLSEDLFQSFSELTRILDYLKLIEDDLRKDFPLKQNLPLFILVRHEALDLINFIQKRVLKVADLPQTVRDAFDGVAYAIGMELKKVFKYELVGITSTSDPREIYVKVENSHGLLRDCFQQSTVTMAQVFDNSIEGTSLFDVFETRLQQSLVLYRDLGLLLENVNIMEKECGQRPIAPLIEHMRSFREGSMRYLMYKDWESYEKLMDETIASRGFSELQTSLHRFACYLSTLYRQIGMRAVIANKTANP
jgi:hypothetical protein